MLKVLTLLSSVFSSVKNFISKLLENPSLLLNLITVIALCLLCFKYVEKSNELSTTKIELSKYKTAFETEKDAHRKTIEDHNKAITELKEKADQIAKENEEKAKEIQDQKKRYKDLYDKYSSKDSDIPEDTEDRILRLELRNDMFFKDYKGIDK